ncbi:ATP-dependent RNA helicase (Hrh1) [Purpureocillium lavendulum]|uniref:ATP-dependent RNA helicase (Hrh1) n=1 Tax=Purpureocillium lavendulum TaxID=1247861 RepID=A0AB34G3E3_9HYPO|nr:ATP-dependent RNA helicase (Hrh1) [Purpureocillium lavendulum]
MSPARMEWAAATQKRVSAASKFLPQIKSHKMMDLATYVSKRLRGLRVDEANASKKFRTDLVWILGVVSMAYCDQMPWLRNQSIRDNVMTENQYDPMWYDAVIRSCALDQDIARLPVKDHTNTMVGSGSVNLSGGQKQRASGKLPLLWLRTWTEHGTTPDTTIYPGVYIMPGIVAIILSAVVFWWYGLFVIPRSGVYTHQLLLDGYLGAPPWFLAKTDNGPLLNRCSQGMSFVDQEMRMAFFETVLNTADTVAAAAIITSGAPCLGGVMAVSTVVIYFLQQFYLKTSKTIQSLDLHTKSPL